MTHLYMAFFLQYHGLWTMARSQNLPITYQPKLNPKDPIPTYSTNPSRGARDTRAIGPRNLAAYPPLPREKQRGSFLHLLTSQAMNEPEHGDDSV